MHSFTNLTNFQLSKTLIANVSPAGDYADLADILKQSIKVCSLHYFESRQKFVGCWEGLTKILCRLDIHGSETVFAGILIFVPLKRLIFNYKLR